MLVCKPTALVASALLALAAIHGCGSDPSRSPDTATDDYASTPQSQPQSANEFGAGTPAPAAGTTEPRPTPPAEPPAPAMTDEQILGIVDAAHDKEIEESKAVEAKLKNKDVKVYARMMVMHHGDAKAKQAKLQQKLGTTPAPSDGSKLLAEDMKKTIDELKVASADVDKLYLEKMIKDHKDVLEMIDAKLMPSAKNAELKAFLSQIRPTIEKHLADAEALAAKLATTPAPGGGPSKSPTGVQPGAPPSKPGVSP